MRKIQGVLTNECAKAFRLRVGLQNAHDMSYMEGRTEHDINHTQLCIYRSQISRILVGSLFYYENRLTPHGFVYFMRYFLNLPALVPSHRDTGAQAGIKGEASHYPLCDAGHCSPHTLDPTANHAVGCRGSFGPRYGLHERINRTITKFAREAGGQTEREPPTVGLLQHLCTPDQCRTWFPKKTNPASRVRAMQLRQMVDQAHRVDRGPAKQEIMNKIHAFALATPGGTKGLRIDSRITFSDEEYWVDAGAVHPTPNCATSQITKWVKAHTEANTEAGGILRMNAMLMEPSPRIRARCNEKHDTYRGLIDIAHSQHKAGSRATMPVFVAAIISHTGEMAPELVTLVENITRQYAKTITPGDQEDGVSRNRKTGMFRARFKDALMSAMAEGFGRLLAAAGRIHVPYINKQTVLEGFTMFLPSQSYNS
jgi:hypothetical protein